jgi:drug efflux transport system permease protein
MLGVGLLTSTVSSTQQPAMVTAFFFVIRRVCFRASGFPAVLMSQWLQLSTYLVPLQYVLIFLRGVYLKAVGLEILWLQFLGMAVLGASLPTLGLLRFHKPLDRGLGRQSIGLPRRRISVLKPCRSIAEKLG